jgi:hypothetical protein
VHFEILVEDASGKIALTEIVKKILGPHGDPHTWKIIAYKGVGRIPTTLRGASDPAKRILLDQLPRLLKGYGKSLPAKNHCVIVVVDLDDKNCMEFMRQLRRILNNCRPAPLTKFRIAIEEIEAWYLGDRNALLTAYPKANVRLLDSYHQDSICGTWEKLADAIHPGGSKTLKNAGWPLPGKEKCKWAEKISGQMDVKKNKSKSFQAFRDCLLELAKN